MHTDGYLTLETGDKGKEKQENCGAMATEVGRERGKDGKRRRCVVSWFVSGL